MHAMSISTLETERLLLIPPNIDCFDVYQDFYTDEKASTMYGGPISSAQTWSRLKADIGSWHLLGFGIWIIQIKSSKQMIGTCGFWQGHLWPRELTWWLLPDARGKGFAKEASLAAVAFAYEKLDFPTVETYMNDENLAARKLVEKLGGRKLRRELFPDKLERDIFLLPNASFNYQVHA